MMGGQRIPLADHRENSRKGVGRVGLEGYMENGGVVDNFMDSFKVVASYGGSACVLETGEG